MRGLPPIASTESFRVRRWDAIVLGGALPGLITAIRLAKRGSRVLVLEEDRAISGFHGMREPFLMTGAASDQPLGGCLRALGIPLIDQRRFVTRDLALQVVLPDARVGVGLVGLTLDEFTAWGLAKPDTARTLLLALENAAEAERIAMLSSPIVRRRRLRDRTTPDLGAMRGRAETGRASVHPLPRGLPAEFASAPPRARFVLETICEALADGAVPSPEAQARLLGGVLSGAAVLAGADGGLRGILRRRVESLFGEFRSVSGSIRLVEVAHQPGLTVGDSNEIWAGRALILNAPRTALAGVLTQDVPDLLRVPRPTHQKVSIHLRGPRSALPPAMAENVVLARCSRESHGNPRLVTIRTFPGGGPNSVDILASARVRTRTTDGEASGDAIERAVRDLIPFSESTLARQPLRMPLWDTDAVAPDAEPGSGWPAGCDVRVSTRPLVYALERSSLAGLGFEGDLLLGWRAGDAIADELA